MGCRTSACAQELALLGDGDGAGAGATSRRRRTAGRGPSVNLYGETGLIDMPSAEMQPDGQITVSYRQFGNTSRRNFTFQILPRLSATLRYSTIKDWGRNDDPDYDLFDRSFDLQFQLLQGRGTGCRRWRSASATSSAPASTRPSTWWPRRRWRRTSP